MVWPLQDIHTHLKTSYIRGDTSTVAPPYNLETAQKNWLSTVMNPPEAFDHQSQQADTVFHNLDAVSPVGTAGVEPQTELQAIILNEETLTAVASKVLELMHADAQEMPDAHIRSR